MRALGLTLCVTAALVSGASAVSRAQSADEAGIRAQLAGYAEARQRGDGRAEASFYTADAEVWRLSTRKMTVGLDQIAKELFASTTPRSFRLDVRHVSFLTADVAVADTEFYSAAAAPDGWTTYVMVKQGERWLIRTVRIIRYPEASPPAPR